MITYGKEQATQIPCGLFILEGVNSRGLPTLRMWQPKASKPFAAYYYPTEEAKQKALNNAIRSMELHEQRKQARKLERKGQKTRTSVIKSALRKKFSEYQFSVTKGTGTACGWIHVDVDAPRTAFCFCKIDQPYCSQCRERSNMIHSEVYKEVVDSLAKENMSLSHYCSDDGYGTERSELLIHISFPKLS
tara:strand:- start:301 stop:870 length:570 start_codon:yes stop_codon:yes gene_type:complete